MVDNSRVQVYQTEEGEPAVGVTAGAAQGFTLGSDLWNSGYGSLLRLNMPDETLSVEYAHDVAAHDIEQARIKLNRPCGV